MVTVKRELRAGERAALVDAASGMCQNPACAEPLIEWRDHNAIINFEIAHIRDELPPSDPEADVGWRYWPADDLGQNERNRFENLLLLCAPCHKLIDRVDPRSYTVEILHQWKASAEDTARPLALDESLGALGAEGLLGLIAEALGTPAPLHLQWPGAGSSGDLLNFASRETAHIGMEEELQGLRDFLEDPAPFFWWIIAGEAGVGKSRLALELCAEASTVWYAGFLTEAEQNNFLNFEPIDPTLVIVDYAAARSEWLGSALYNHSVRAGSYRAPLRIVILERSSRGAWLSDALREKRHNESQDILSHQYATPIDLEGLSDDNLRCLIADVSLTRGRSLSTTETEYVLDRTLEIDPLRRPLFAIVATLDELGDEERGQTRDALLRSILQRRLARQVEEFSNPLLANLAGGLELIATAIGGIEPDRYESLRSMAAQMGLVQLPTVGELSAHRAGYCIQGIRPDILGELAVLDSLQREDVLTRQSAFELLRLAWRFDPLRCSAFIERAARDHPWSSGLGEVLELNPDTDTERDLWFDLAPRLVSYLRSSSNPSIERISRQLDSQATESEQRAGIAKAALGFHFGNLLLNEDRVEGAVGIFSEVIDRSSPAWDSYSNCLTNRGVAYIQLDRIEDALADFTTVIDSTMSSDEARACCLNNRADIRSEAHDSAGSIADRTAVLQLSDTTYNRRYIALVRRARSLWESGDHTGAFADLHALLETPDIVIEQKLNARLIRAGWRIESGQIALAKEDLEQVVVGRRNFEGVSDEAVALLDRLGTDETDIVVV